MDPQQLAPDEGAVRHETRRDRFGDIADCVQCSVRDLRVQTLPRDCAMALREGLRDSRRCGLGAWRRHDRLFYVALAGAVGVLALALLSRLVRSSAVRPVGFYGPPAAPPPLIHRLHHHMHPSLYAALPRW